MLVCLRTARKNYKQENGLGRRDLVLKHRSEMPYLEERLWGTQPCCKEKLNRRSKETRTGTGSSLKFSWKLQGRSQNLYKNLTKTEKNPKRQQISLPNLPGHPLVSSSFLYLCSCQRLGIHRTLVLEDTKYLSDQTESPLTVFSVIHFPCWFGHRPAILLGSKQSLQLSL